MDCLSGDARLVRLFFISLVAILITVIMNCAEVAAPPGGEVDKAAPFLIGSSPVNGSTNVEPSNTVVLFFSERVVKPEVKKSVYVSPRPANEPEVKWKSDKLIVTLDESFKPNQTYVISVNSQIKDLRNNTLDSAMIVAFSTGATIDSGQIGGRVMLDTAGQSGVLVGLYRSDVLNDSVPLDSIHPEFIAITNRDGYFMFKFLPVSSYKLIAIRDKNQDEYLSPYQEQFGLPDRVVDLRDSLPLRELVLPLTQQDTLTPTITGVSYTADKLFRVKLSSEIKLEYLKSHVDGLTLRSQADSGVVGKGQSLLESERERSASVTFYAGDIPPGVYRAEMPYDEKKPLLVSDTFSVSIKEDKTVPRIVAFTPDNQPQFLEQLEIQATFSEAIDTSALSAATFVLWVTDSAQGTLTHEWLDPLRLRLRSDAFLPGMKARVDITEFEIKDLAGNVMGDSLISYPIVIINDDSVGTVEGSIRVTPADRESDPVVLQFARAGSNQTFSLPVTGRDFTIALPAGKYLLTGFVDSDHDGRRGLGSIDPWVLSETVAAYDDTVSVRARFETAGIEMEFK